MVTAPAHLLADLTEAEIQEAVVERARQALAALSDAAYRDALQIALSLPGNVLSSSPNLRWARPVWTCCVAAGGQWQAAVRCAAALEMFMAALDLLDDVEDDEGSPVCSALGQPRALNASTGLLFLALRGLLDAADGAALTSTLLDAGIRACGGQHADLSPAIERGDLEGALSITAAKSGSLVEAVCRLGAHAGGADARLRDRFAQFGRCFGIVAQLANDLAALDPLASGKTDSALCRPTLPLIYTAPGVVDEDGAADLGPLEPISFTWTVAATYRQHALDMIPRLTGSASSRAALAELLNLL